MGFVLRLSSTHVKLLCKEDIAKIIFKLPQRRLRGGLSFSTSKPETNLGLRG